MNDENENTNEDSLLTNLKMEASLWWKRGIHGRRTWEEYQCYIDGIETAVHASFDRLGKYSQSAYMANTIFSALGDYIEKEFFKL